MIYELLGIVAMKIQLFNYCSYLIQISFYVIIAYSLVPNNREVKGLRWLVGLKLIQLEQQKTQLPLIILTKYLKPILYRVIKGI